MKRIAIPRCPLCDEPPDLAVSARFEPDSEPRFWGIKGARWIRERSGGHLCLTVEIDGERYHHYAYVYDPTQDEKFWQFDKEHQSRQREPEYLL